MNISCPFLLHQGEFWSRTWTGITNYGDYKQHGMLNSQCKGKQLSWTQQDIWSDLSYNKMSKGQWMSELIRGMD
jgi:hypothetical protein